MKLVRSKLFWFAAVIVAAGLALMLWSGITGRPSFLSNATGAVVTPLQNGVAKVMDAFSDFFGYFYRYDALERENEELRQKLQEYENLENSYYSAIKENTALREAAGVRRKHADFEMELCSVVSVDGSGFRSAMTLSRGSLSGIEVGDPVITGDGLVGYVAEVGLNHCAVKNIINTDFTASAVVSRTREVVVTQGNFELAADGLLKIVYLENNADIRPGDKIVTNGGTYPRNLIIGQVVDFLPEAHGISSYASVRPAVELDGLSTVFVIKDFDVED